jgi:hypothetical protein
VTQRLQLQPPVSYSCGRNKIQWIGSHYKSQFAAAALTLRLNEGRVEFSAQQGVGQVSEKLLQEGGGVVRAQVRVHLHLPAAVEILPQLFKTRIFWSEFERN